MNIFLRVGQWLEARFPEKISAEEVLGLIDHLTKRIECLEPSHRANIDLVLLHQEKIKKLEADLETLKTNMTVKTRIAGSSPVSLTPFAQRLQPVQPANSSGGVPLGHK